MSHLVYIFAVMFHILSVVFWLGSAMFLVLAAVPYFKRRSPEKFREFLAFSETRLRSTSWAAFAVLLVTGLYALHYRFGLSSLGDPSFWHEAPGLFLLYKLLVVGVIVALSFWHDFFVGPRTLRVWKSVEKGDTQLSQELAVLRRRTATTGRLIAVLALIAIFFAIRVVRG